MKRILTIILVAIATNCYSQKDIYYIKSNYDTVFCKKMDCWFVGVPPLNYKFKFNATPLNGKSQNIELNDIIGFQGFFSPTEHSRNALKSYNILIKFEVHIVKELSTKNPIPLRIIVEENGKKLLLNIYPYNQRTVSQYYFSDGNSVEELNKKNYIEKLKILFSGYKEVTNQLNDIKNNFLYERRVEDLIKEYYKCINKKFIHEK